MQLKFESTNLDDYRKEIPGVCDFNTPLVSAQVEAIENKAASLKERAQFAFEVARDSIQHSFDTQSKIITISAEETLAKREGICFAKSHLLTTLLRKMGIPAGFCYQRVLRKADPNSGHALHGLNAVYLEETGWFRLDPRGNKPGVHSEFSTTIEKLAYPIRPELGEIDYDMVFTAPLPEVIDAMHNSADCQTLFYNRPEKIAFFTGHFESKL